MFGSWERVILNTAYILLRIVLKEAKNTFSCVMSARENYFIFFDVKIPFEYFYTIISLRKFLCPILYMWMYTE